jgi:hypothetical protein
MMESAIHKTAKVSTELFIVLFGLWTVSSHIAVVFQLPFSALAFIFPLLFGAGLFLLFKTGFFSDWKKTHLIEKPNKITLAGFMLVVLMMLFFALFANKYNFDDAHYIRMAVDMVDHPEKPLLLMDPLGLFEGAPLLITVYKAQSVEVFCAAISSITGIPAIYIFHFFLPVLGLFLSVMAYLLLFRVLIPQKAVLATIISFALIYAVSLRAFGNITFTRIYQGKFFMLAVILPLVITYGLKAAKDNRSRDWVILVLAQVSAIGMNATALWLAPLTANLAVMAGTLAGKPTFLIRNTLFGVLSSIYVVSFGLYLVIFFQMPPFYASTGMDALKLITISVSRVFGDGIAMYVSLFVIFFTWLFAPNRLTKMISLIFPAFLLLVFYNPLVAGIVAKYAVSEETYWRAAWLIPFQLFIGIIGISVFVKNKPGWLIYPKAAFIIGMFIVFILDSPAKTRVFAKNSSVDIKWPALKVAPEYYIAKRINNVLDERDVLLSPNRISIWISTMHHQPKTLVYRSKFSKGLLYQYSRKLRNGGQAEMDKFLDWAGWYKPVDFQYPSETPLARKIRKMEEETGVHELRIILNAEFELTLKEYISGKTRPKNAQEYFAKGLDHYRVTAVCLPEKLKWKKEVVEVLDNKGFIHIETVGKFELWKKELTN